MALVNYGGRQYNTSANQSTSPGGGSGSGAGGTAAGGGIGASTLAMLLKMLGPKLYQQYIKPELFGELGTETGAGGGAVEAAAPSIAADAAPSYYAGTEAYPAMEGGLETGLSAGATEGASEGAATSMGAGSWASVLAPLVATWSAYTRGSGRNDPVEKRNETSQLLDIFGGGEGNVQNYDNSGNIIPWTQPEIWNRMHSMGKGHGGQNTGDSGLSDSEIDNAIFAKGTKPEELAKILGLSEMPDWSNQSYDTWFAKNYGGTKDNPIFMGQEQWWA